MARKIVLDPITRIEGHLKIEVSLDGDNTVEEAISSGTLFRGIEIILKGRDPRDALRITQRICGVCPTAHSTASALCLDSAFGIADKIPDNGRIIRNLILGSNYLHNHILHFYHLSALDYLDITRAERYDDPELQRLKEFIRRGELAPFLPRLEGDYRLSDEDNRALLLNYIRALDIRRKAHEMLSIFGGKMPHNMGIVAGGATSSPTTEKIASFLWRLNEIRDFIENSYLPDVIRVAKAYQDHFEIGGGWGNFLSFGVFDLDGSEPDYTKGERLLRQGALIGGEVRALDPSKISEELKHSWYAGPEEPHPRKEGAYSFIKSPRYDGEVVEVGPLARAMVNYRLGNERVRKALDRVLSEVGVGVEALNSVMGRHIARAVEAKLVADAMAEWVLELKPDEPAFVDYDLPEEAEGMGLVGAPRGALGHWITIKGGRIERYVVISPTTWNASPKDDSERPGPIERALMGTKVKDPENPFEVVRIVRSFDPCLACAVQLVSPKGEVLRELRAVG